MGATGHVGKLSVLIGGNGDELRGELKKTGKDVKGFVKDTNEELGKLGRPNGGPKDGGFGAAPEEAGVLNDLAKHIRKLRSDSAKSGERGLAKVLGSGDSLSEAALQSLGLGMQGIAVDAIGRGFSNSMETVNKLSSGELGLNEFSHQLAEGLPLIGEFVKGWTNVLSLIDGSAKAEAELNRQMKDGAMVQQGLNTLDEARSRRMSFDSPSDFAREALGINQERISKEAELGEKRNKIEEEEQEAQNKASSVPMRLGASFLRKLSAFSTLGLTNFVKNPFLDKLENQFSESSAAVQMAMKPFEESKRLLNSAQKEQEKLSQDQLHRLNEESLEQMEKSIAASRLGRSMAVGGSPEEILAARQAVARANMNADLKPIDREMAQNAAAIKAGQGINGLSLEEVKARQEKLQEERAAIVKAGEAEITRMTIDETRRREDAIFDIESGMNRARLGIMSATAKSAEDELAARLEGIKEQVREELGAIDQRLANPSIGADERKKLTEERAMTEKAGAAAQERAKQDEARRQANSVMGIEHDMARQRLKVQEANTHDVAGLWSVREASIKEEFQENLDRIDAKLKDVNLSEAERNALIKQRQEMLAGEPDILKRAKEDFDRETRRAQQGNAGTLLGVASGLLSDRQGIYGGNNAAAIKMQKRLGAMSEILSMRQQIESVLAPDSRANDEQKKAAKEALGALGDWQKYALSNKNLNQTPYVPLRHAEGEEANSGYSGAAEYQTEADENNYAKGANMIDEQRETNRLLASIEKMMMAGGRDGSNPLFP